MEYAGLIIVLLIWVVIILVICRVLGFNRLD
jgi:hypothetical protein